MFIIKRITKYHSALLSLFLCTVLFAIPPQAAALTINRNFVAPEQYFSDSDFFMGDNPADLVLGGGNLIGIFNAAADMWERAILDDYELTLYFGWNNRPSPVLGSFLPWTIDDTSKRVVEGFVLFDNDDERGFYMDPNPNDHKEFPLFNQYYPNNDPTKPVGDIPSEVDLGAGPVNASREFTGGPGTWNPFMYFDMFSLALHEIGHALVPGGWYNPPLENSIIITEPRPFTGSVIPIESDGYHLYVSSPGWGIMSTVMNIGIGLPGSRKVLTDVDILAAAELGQFTQPNFNVIDTEPVPEPTTMLLLGTGLVGVAGAARRKKKNQA